MSELSREQVEEQCRNIVYASNGDEGTHAAANQLQYTDATLRATIEQQAQEIARLEGERDEAMQQRRETIVKIADDVREQLATAQARLYKYDHWTPEHTIEEWLADRQRIVDAKQVEADAQLQARVAVLEKGFADQTAIRERREVGFTETIAQLQATLAKREEELEAYAWTISPAMAQAKIDGQNQQLAKAALAIQELQEALRFYADPQSYGISGGTVDRIIQDAGKRAQRALTGKVLP